MANYNIIIYKTEIFNYTKKQRPGVTVQGLARFAVTHMGSGEAPAPD